MFDTNFKIDVGDYYFYDKNDNLIDCVKELQKEIYSYGSGNSYCTINLIGCKVHKKLINQIKQIKKFACNYLISTNGGNASSNKVTEVFEDFIIDNIKIITEKNEVATINIKLKILGNSYIDSNINLENDKNNMTMNDFLNELVSMWDVLGIEEKDKISNIICGDKSKDYGKYFIPVERHLGSIEEIRDYMDCNNINKLDIKDL